jgi:serine/threonine-protein kinase
MADPPLVDPSAATLRAPAAELPGAQLEDLIRHDRYEPGPIIGKGGMGEVRQCQDTRLHREIALKTATTKDRAELSRFVREAQVQGQLEHPGIVPVHELGLGADGAPFFAMKRVHGETLAEVLALIAQNDARGQEKYPRHKLVQAFQSVCQAVDYAHTHGWIHRDLKPANVMLGDFGEVYVLDWGLARRLEEADDAVKLESAIAAPGLTTPGSLMGTPGYISPEVVQGQTADVRSDVYALGAILFELLTHQMLVVGDTAIELLLRTKAGGDARARQRAPQLDVPPELEAVCIKATQVDPAKRYASVRELHAAVDRVLAGERDLDLRSELATRHTQAATQAAAQAGSDPGHELDHRKTALRELGLALALIPSHRPALEALLGVMSAPLREAPPEAEAELAAGLVAQRRTAARGAFYIFLALGLSCILLTFHRVRHEWSPLLFLGLSLVTALHAAWVAWRRRRVESVDLTISALLAFLTLGSLFSMDGPLTLLPVTTAVCAAGFAAVSSRGQRPFIIALGMLTVAFPLLGSWFGLLPESFRYVKDGLLLLPMEEEFDPLGSTLIYAGTYAFAVVLACVVVGSVRDTVGALSRRSALQSWNLRQMLPPEAAGAPTVASAAADSSRAATAPDLPAPR